MTSSHLSVCADSSAAIVPMSQLGRVQISVYNQRRLVKTFLQCGRIFLTSSAREKRLIASPPLSGHTWRTHGASSSSRFKPYGKQQRAKVRGDEQSQLLAGLQGWFGERPTIPCSVSWTSHYYRLVLSGAICSEVLVNYKPCAFFLLEMHA